MSPNLLTRIIATDSAMALLASLREKHGPLLFFLPGGSNDGNSPVCYALGEFIAGNSDVYLGNLEGTPFYVGHEQFEYWNRAQLIIDTTNGAGASDSLDSGTGKRFLTRSRLLSDEENMFLEQTEFAGTHRATDRV